MGDKAILVQVDEDRWRLAKARSTNLGITASEFVDQAIANHLVATERVEAIAVSQTMAANTSYLSSVSSDLTKSLGIPVPPAARRALRPSSSYTPRKRR